MWQRGFPLPLTRQRRKVYLESEWNLLEEELSSSAVVVVVVAVVAEVLGSAVAEVAPSASGGDLSAPCSGSGDAPHEPAISKIKLG